MGRLSCLSLLTLDKGENISPHNASGLWAQARVRSSLSPGSSEEPGPRLLQRLGTVPSQCGQGAGWGEKKEEWGAAGLSVQQEK